MTKITHFLKHSTGFLRKQWGSCVRGDASYPIPSAGTAGSENLSYKVTRSPVWEMQRRGDMWQQSWQLWALENTLLQTRRVVLEACPLLWQLLSRLTPAVGLGFLCLRVPAPPSTEPYQGHPTLPTHPGLQGEVFCWARFSLRSSFLGLLHP